MAVLSTLETLNPIVKWAQNGPKIHLTIELTDVKNPKIAITENVLEFTGYGHGAKGEDIYQFTLEFFQKIDNVSSSYKITDRNVSFEIMKQEKLEEWPRLLLSDRKPAWLKIDFDKWKLEDSEKENNDDDDIESGEINKISFEQRVKSDVEKAKNDIKIYTKVAWLTIYNLLQTICFSIILMKIIFQLWKHGKDAVDYVYEDVSDLLLTCQLAAILEIINPLVGIVKTGVVAPFMQVCGRNMLLFVLIVPEKSFHNDYVTVLLFLVWATVEVIRYPFYLLTLHRMHSMLLAWLRYSAWLILYPAGFISEAIIVYRSIQLASTASRFAYPLPNPLNISFNLRSLLIGYLCVYTPLCLYLMKHMWILRQRKLGGQKKAKSKVQ